LGVSAAKPMWKMIQKLSLSVALVQFVGYRRFNLDLG
jgi:hypothetical protein